MVQRLGQEGRLIRYPGNPVPSPRKVLFISADQWRGECLSVLGHPVVKTPHLDALVADGVLFKRHFSVTSPCGPSRSSMHTGMYLMNHRSGRNGTPLDRRHTNIAHEVRKLGLDPMLFGYTDTSVDPRGLDPLDPALRTFEGPLPGYHIGLLFPDYIAAWMSDLRKKGYAFEGRHDVYQPKPDFVVPADRGHRFIPTIFKAEDSDTNFMADAVIEWLGDHRQQDWFMHCVFLRPHPPVITPEPYNARYDPADIELPRRHPSAQEEARLHPHLAQRIRGLSQPNKYDEHNPLNLVEMPDLELRQMRACYYGMMSEVDDAVGRIVAHLKETGEYDSTLILFTCDHGEMGGDHYTWGKETTFDQSFFIPLIIRDPRPAAQATRARHVDSDLHGLQVANDVRHLCVRRGRGEVAADETIEVALQAGITFWRGKDFLAEGEQLLDPLAELVGEAGQIAARLFGHADEASFSEREGRLEYVGEEGKEMHARFVEFERRIAK